MSFYIKRSYVDSQPGIELVNIHYTWTPVGQPPNWEAHRETRAMPRGGVLIKGLGGTTVAESGEYVQTLSQKVELPDDGTRRKVIALPNDILDPATGQYIEHYAFHHYFEIFREGKRETSPLYSEEILSKEVEYLDYTGNLGECAFSGVCMIGTRPSINRPRCRPSLKSLAKTAPTAPSSFTARRTRKISPAFARKCCSPCPRHGASSARFMVRKGRKSARVGTLGNTVAS